jgi:SAM-dependent methyltransferase
MPAGCECRICGNVEGNSAVEAREMMFGTREIFRYFQCARCRCLQIGEIPANLSRYYPSGYYSFHATPLKPTGTRLRRALVLARNRRAVLGQGLLGRILYSFKPLPKLREQWRRTNITRECRIVEVGCGSGALVQWLATIGPRRPLGIDPFIDHDADFPNGARIEKKALAELTGQFDLVLFNHSLEHLPDQVATLKLARDRLAPDGMCRVAVPLADSWAHEHYGTNWVQLDAPRHLYLHTPESLRIVAEKAGFTVRDIFYDSFELQFWGSEQYAVDIPLRS